MRKSCLKIVVHNDDMFTLEWCDTRDPIEFATLAVLLFFKSPLYFEYDD